MPQPTDTPLPQQSPSVIPDDLLRKLPVRPAPGLYIHVPFCFHKCHYCDFYSLVDSRDRQPAFVERLARELDAWSPRAGQPLQTLFVGGGTPTLLRTDLWITLLRRLDASFDLSAIRRGQGEFTVECNPETASPELLASLRAGGVTRLSVGAQSFHPAHLKTLERWHDPANVARALTLARDAGISRLSLDLIFGIPGQTLADWDRDLDQALALGVEHLSCYNLTYEPGTAMTARLARGEFHTADEDLEVEMFHHTARRLAAAGLHRYEISNFARPGAECRHNLAYWRQEPWLAAGPSASAHLAGCRWKNVPRLDDYLRLDARGFCPATDFEPPDPRRALRERLMTGLRLAEGLSIADTLARADRVDPAIRPRLARTASRAIDRGHLHPDTARWRLTDQGAILSQSVILDFMSAADA